MKIIRGLEWEKGFDIKETMDAGFSNSIVAAQCWKCREKIMMPEMHINQKSEDYLYHVTQDALEENCLLRRENKELRKRLQEKAEG